MLGTLRFFLAWIVMLSHWPALGFASGFNLGVTAVVLFYFISGYLMYLSYERKQSVKHFYIDRLLRLWPLYLIVLFSTALAVTLLAPIPSMSLLNQPLDASKLLANGTIVLNNYVFAPWQLDTLLPHPLIPPAWSLGTEVHFYLLLPLLAYLFRRMPWLFYGIFASSLGCELLAWSSNSPLFNADNFGYRYIPGVLWIFMLGFLYASGSAKRWGKVLFGILLLYATIGIPALHATGSYVREMLLGVMLIPVVLSVIRMKDFTGFDRKLGQLSYPLFLSHFLLFFIGMHYFEPSQMGWMVLPLIITATILAYIQYYVDKLRHKVL